MRVDAGRHISIERIHGTPDIRSFIVACYFEERSQCECWRRRGGYLVVRFRYYIAPEHSCRPISKDMRLWLLFCQLRAISNTSSMDLPLENQLINMVKAYLTYRIENIEAQQSQFSQPPCFETKAALVWPRVMRVVVVWGRCWTASTKACHSFYKRKEGFLSAQLTTTE